MSLIDRTAKTIARLEGEELLSEREAAALWELWTAHVGHVSWCEPKRDREERAATDNREERP